MDLFQQHRDALLNVLSKECSQFYITLREELDRRDEVARRIQESGQAELESLRERAAKADTLQKENDQLRARLEATPSAQSNLRDIELHPKLNQLRLTSGETGQNLDSKFSEDEKVQDQTSVSRAKYEKLAADFHQLYRNYQTFREAQEKLIMKWNKQKRTIELWKTYAKKVHDRAERRRKRLGPESINNSFGGEVLVNSAQAQLHESSAPSKATTSGLQPGLVVKEAITADSHRSTSLIPAILDKGVSPVPSISNEVFARRTTTRALAEGPGHDHNSPHKNCAQSQDLSSKASESTGMEAKTFDKVTEPNSSRLPALLQEMAAVSNEQADAAENSPQPTMELPISRTVKAQHAHSDVTDDGDDQVAPDDSPTIRPTGDRELVSIESPELSSDPPVIVSERSLKRRRRRSESRTTSTANEPRASIYGSAMKPIRVKSEPDSSSPIGFAGLRGWQETNESMDLDEIGDIINTPRKRRRFQDLIRGSQRAPYIPRQVVVDPARTERDFSATCKLEQASVEETPQSDHTATSKWTDNTIKNGPVASPLTKGLNMDILNANLELARREDDEAVLFLASLSPAERQTIVHESLQDMEADFPRWMNRRLPPEHSGHKRWTRRNSTDAPTELAYQTPQMLLEDSALVPGDDRKWAGENPGKKVRTSSNSDGVLNPRDLNIKVLPRTSDVSKHTRPKRGRRKGRDSAAARMHIVAEDGEEVHRTNQSKADSTSFALSKENADDELRHQKASFETEIQQRLVDLLEEPSPMKQFLPGPMRSVNSRYGGLQSAGVVSPKGRTVSPDADGSAEHVGILNAAYRSHNCDHIDASNWSETAQPDDEPFRARPLRRLGLEHFKINPDYNQGLDYAFVETVRNGDQRQCLPGCTRPECCGDKFRKLVKIGGVPTPQRPGLWDSSQVDEDQRLLEEYLGDDLGRLEVMTDKAKEKLLLEARTKQFADKHGRHRHAYERRTTPPGFWRTDMPTTQETEQDRKDARKLERQKVEERYREAMRPGGRWLFKDE